MNKIRQRQLFTILLVLCFLLSGCLSGSRRIEQSGLPGWNAGMFIDNTAAYADGYLLVKLKPGADRDLVFPAVGGEIIRRYEEIDWYLVNYGAGLNLESAFETLRENQDVLLVEPDYLARICAEPVIPNDPGFEDKQWGLKSINATGGWAYTTGSQEITIAVLDTGIDHEHPDLAEKVVDGYNTFTEDYGTPGDDNGHGTHVAGIAAAKTNNEEGIAGVAWECGLMPVKVLDHEGVGAYSKIADGIIWAVENGADVINMSLGGQAYSRTLQSAVEYALGEEIAVVAAAGNGTKRNDVFYPAAFPGVISVGAVGENEEKAWFSTEGSHLFLAAPGLDIYSTVPGEAYEFWSGTSMAAPFVSGATALIKSQWSNMGINAIHSQLRPGGEEFESPNWNQETGWGLLDLNTVLAEEKFNLYGTLIINVVTIEDGEEEAPVAYARVLLEENTGAGDGRVCNTLANIDGRALFTARPAGSYKVTVNGQWSENVEVVAGEEIEIIITINED